MLSFTQYVLSHLLWLSDEEHNRKIICCLSIVKPHHLRLEANGFFSLLNILFFKWHEILTYIILRLIRILGYKFLFKHYQPKQMNLLTTHLLTCYMFSPDIDECSAGVDICDDNAVCKNTQGSYTCRCKAGYSGDGKTCSGKTFAV